jgi:hypothetical protein
MAQQFLNSANIVAVLQKVGSEAVPKGMATNFFVDLGLLYGLLGSFLQATRMQMMSSDNSGARIGRKIKTRKGILPNPLFFGVGILAF